MNYNTLLDLATNVGYELAMAGAETFRVEESIVRIMAAYGVEADVFAIPNYLVVSITDEQVDVVVNMAEVDDAGRAQIEDIVKRKTGISGENIVITPLALE